MGCVSRAQRCALSCFVIMRTAVCVLLLRLRPNDCLFWFQGEHASFESRLWVGYKAHAVARWQFRSGCEQMLTFDFWVCDQVFVSFRDDVNIHTVRIVR